MPHLGKRIADDIYCYIWQGRGNNCNTYVLASLLRGKRPHVIIDPGFLVNELGERCFDSLVRTMQADGLRAEEIGLIVNTHTHPDHCQATEAIVEASARSGVDGGVGQALTALSVPEAEYYSAVGEKMFAMFGMNAAKLDPCIYLVEGDLVLSNGNRKVALRVLHTPGHSPGSICIYWPDRKVLVTGDVLFYASVGRTDFPGGSITDLKQSIEKLAQLDVEYVLPGHSTELGSVVEGREKVRRNFNAVRMFF
ncbi:MAG: hypothetical protein DRI39_06730 [Chloroflexi bacterium]|nr:MAG: hypothetical protein DRI39_06730 [Chloroflexota bacterium]RLC97020.1 MAG: hypothetical protein DRI40_01510 [Chloroflexota bacterium]